MTDENMISDTDNGGQMLNQVQVNDVIKRERERAAKQERERVTAELSAAYERKLEESLKRIPQNQPVDEEALYGKFEQRMQKKYEADMRAQRAREVSDMYHDKVKKGSELYEDFESMIADFDPEAFPEIAVLAAEHDNTFEIIRELSDNPEKMGQILMLAKEPGGAPLARKAMKKLSSSIERNQEALQVRKPNPPLSKVKSSNLSGVDSQPNSIDDLRKMDYLRG